MSPQQPVLKAQRRKEGVSLLPPSDVRQLAPLLLVSGVLLTIIGTTDMALLWIPPRFGDAEWEFGTIGQTMDSLPAPTIGLALLAAGVCGLGGSRKAAKFTAFLLALVSLMMLAMTALFTLDIGTAMQALRGPTPPPGLKRAIAKTLIFGLCYTSAFAVLAVLVWRRARARAVVPAEPAPAA